MVSKEREAETARNMEIWRQQVNEARSYGVGLIITLFGA